MAVSVKRATLWRTETDNNPGTLAQVLAPFADNKTNLNIVMGYAYADKRRAAIEVFPITTGRSQRAARAAGLQKSDFPCVVISGDDRPGLGHAVAAALSDAGINLNFCVAQTLGKRYTGIFSFEAASEADLAVRLIRKALARSSRTSNRARKGTAPRPAPRKSGSAAGRSTKKTARRRR